MPFVKPIPGATVSRVDQGVDLSASPGTPILAIATSRVIGKLDNWYAGQPYWWFQILSGEGIGRFWYAAEQVDLNVRPGQVVQQGQQIGRYASSGTATEFGWADRSGRTLSVAHGTQNLHPNHADTPEGLDFLASVIKGGVSKMGAGGAGGSAQPVAAPAGQGGGAGDAQKALWAQYEAELGQQGGAKPVPTALLTSAISSAAGATSPTVPRAGAPGKSLGSFIATAYGPPWGGIEGGGQTASGMKLPSAPTGKVGPPYVVAVDPSVIPMHSKLQISPNPAHDDSIIWSAEDTGGAIKGNRIDFLVLTGRSAQDGWGVRPVKVSHAGAGSTFTAAPAGGAQLPPDAQKILNEGPFGYLYAPISDAVNSVADLAKWVAWIFHPRNILRVVEFLSGIGAMIAGLYGVIGQPGGAGEIAEDVVGAMTPVKVRQVRGRSRGRRHARSQSRRTQEHEAYRKGKRQAQERSGKKTNRRESRKIKASEIPF